MAIAAGIDRVLEVGPVFRAEPSFTSRHATEFTGVDVELAWIDDVEDVMDLEERMLVHVLAAAADRHGLDVSIPAAPVRHPLPGQCPAVLPHAPGRVAGPDAEQRPAVEGHLSVKVTANL
jgi:hypothetical protein